MPLPRLIDRLRAWPWLAGALITTLIVAWMAPHQIGVLVWSLSKLALGAYLGYWIDRSVFPYARPGEIQSVIDASAGIKDDDLRLAGVDRLCSVFNVATIRRALIMGMVILALGLGV